MIYTHTHTERETRSNERTQRSSYSLFALVHTIEGANVKRKNKKKKWNLAWIFKQVWGFYVAFEDSSSSALHQCVNWNEYLFPCLIYLFAKFVTWRLCTCLWYFSFFTFCLRDVIYEIINIKLKQPFWFFFRCVFAEEARVNSPWSMKSKNNITPNCWYLLRFPYTGKAKQMWGIHLESNLLHW